MDTLKPCPYCGSHALQLTTLGSDERVVCADCSAIGPPGDSLFHESRDPYRKAVALWNRRVESEPTSKGRFRADTKHTAE